jgi:hypothetical protein
VTGFLTTALHDGSPWLLLACLVMFIGVGVALYTRTGSGINAHPYAKVGDGSELGTDMPAEATGREEMERILRPNRPPR